MLCFAAFKRVKIPELNQKPIAFELQRQVVAPILDYRGNVRKLVNPTAQITQSNNYTVFGEELTSVIAPINPWRYSAKRFDPDLGLSYFGKRFYSPVLGRWLTTDPAAFVDGTNLYSYLFNDPLNYFDPDGRFAFTLFGLAWGGAGAAASIPILSNPLGWAIGSILITGLAIHWTTNKLVESNQISQSTGNTLNTILGGFGLEFATLGGFTFGFFAAEGSGQALIGHGLSLTTQHAQDIKAHNISWKNTDVYVPDRPLPVTEHGSPLPETNAPHTELGTRDGRKGKYPQAREFDEKGKPVRDIDFTDHGTPHKHPNPHQHPREDNSTGGSRSRENAEALPGWKY